MIAAMFRSLAVLFFALACAGSSFAQAATADPLAPLAFLEGTWSASTNGAGSAGASAIGTYTFRRDLNGHALQRTSSSDQCSGPKSFDCAHHDQLTIFADPLWQAAKMSTLFALYLDSEGHVIYYSINKPDAHTAVFLSEGPTSGPRFRLTYHLEGVGPKAVMTGKFQGAAPGSEEYHSYLEWSGTRQ